VANTDSAKKRIRSSEKKRLHNRVFRSAARTNIKRARLQIKNGELDEAEKTVQAASQSLDKAARKGIIHPRNAARRKSRLTSALASARKE